MAKVFGAKVITFFLIIYNFNFCVPTDIEKFEQYHVVNSPLPNLSSSYSTIIKLREKRQTSTDLKNQYTATTNKQQQQQQQNPPATADTSSVIIPYRPLLGVNGTGQRKDMSDKAAATAGMGDTKTTIVSNPPIQFAAATANATAEKSNKFPKKVAPILTAAATAAPAQTPSPLTTSTESSEERVIDNVDVPENETINTLEKNNFTVNQTTDHHAYYNSTIYVNKDEVAKTWEEIKNLSINSMLSQSHRRALTVELKFKFPFYGHDVRNITVATGGFLYTGEYVHSWLAATQYIAPLMANFDTGLYEDSYVRLNDTGTSFTAVWENVALQGKEEHGKFTFSTTLHKNGDIVFTYFNVPVQINTIQDDKHPVKVGLSDAYIIDKVVYFARRKTIYEYHRVNFNSGDITNNTIIRLTALPTCLEYKDCASCINHETVFDCSWCPISNRCSSGTDRNKQDWLQKGCDHLQVNNVAKCPALGQKGNNAANQPNSGDASNHANNDNSNNNDHEQEHDALHPNANSGEAAIASTTTPLNSNTNNKNDNVLNKATFDASHQPEPKSMGVALGFLVPICLVMAITLWVLYAYRNPHTKSGQLLIQYRPSQWSWRRGEARYTAATIHIAPTQSSSNRPFQSQVYKTTTTTATTAETTKDMLTLNEETDHLNAKHYNMI